MGSSYPEPSITWSLPKVNHPGPFSFRSPVTVTPRTGPAEETKFHFPPVRIPHGKGFTGRGRRRLSAVGTLAHGRVDGWFLLRCAHPRGRWSARTPTGPAERADGEAVCPPGGADWWFRKSSRLPHPRAAVFVPWASPGHTGTHALGRTCNALTLTIADELLRGSQKILILFEEIEGFALGRGRDRLARALSKPLAGNLAVGSSRSNPAFRGPGLSQL